MNCHRSKSWILLKETFVNSVSGKNSVNTVSPQENVLECLTWPVVGKAEIISVKCKPFLSIQQRSTLFTAVKETVSRDHMKAQSIVIKRAIALPA